jgi:hypothetical protein
MPQLDAIYRRKNRLVEQVPGSSQETLGVETAEPEVDVIRFDPDLEYGSEKNKISAYKSYFDAINMVLKNEKIPPVNFNHPTTFLLNKTESSKNLDMYNVYRDQMEKTLRSNFLWNDNVPLNKQEQTIDAWTDEIYGLTKHTQKFLNGYDISEDGKKAIYEITRNQIRKTSPTIFAWAGEEYNQFQNSKRDGLIKTSKQAESSFYEGLGALGIESVLGRDVKQYADQMRLEAESISEAQGYGAMTTGELFGIGGVEGVAKGLTNILYNAYQSLPYQVPSLATSLVARGLSSNPFTFGAGLGLSLGAGGIMETGSFLYETQKMYHQLKSQAFRSREILMNPEHPDYNPELFRKLFSIEMSDGSRKALDLVTDLEIRQMSEGLSRVYGGLSTAVEGLSSFAEKNIFGKIGSGMIKGMKNNNKSAVKAVFKSYFRKPFVSTFLEGGTEATQQGISEALKYYNVPEYSISKGAIAESFAIGAIYGASFSGAGALGRKAVDMYSNKRGDFNLSEEQASRLTQTDKERSKIRPYDNDIILGTNNAGYIEQIAKQYDISADEVVQRQNDLGQMDKLTAKNKKIIANANPQIFEKYGWTNIYKTFAKQQKKTVVQKQGKTVSKVAKKTPSKRISGQPEMSPEAIIQQAMQFNFDDLPSGMPSQIDPDAQAGLDIFDNGNEMNIDLVIEQELRSQIEFTKKNTTLTSNEKRVKLKELQSKLDKATQSLKQPAKVKKKIKKKVEIKQKTKAVVKKTLQKPDTIEGLKRKLNYIKTNYVDNVKDKNSDNYKTALQTVNEYQKRLEQLESKTKKKPVKKQQFSSFDQPLELPKDIQFSEKPTDYNAVKKIRPKSKSLLKDFKDSKKKSFDAYMSLAPRVITKPELRKSPITQDILILENGKAIGEIKANENEKGLRTESLILGKGKNAIIVPNVVSVNNINTQLDKYISPKQTNVPESDPDKIADSEKRTGSMKDIQALLAKKKGTSQLNIFDKLKEDAPDIVKGATGKHINDLFNKGNTDDSDVLLSEIEDMPSIILTGKRKREFDMMQNKLWNATKRGYGLTELDFPDYVDAFKSYWGATVFKDGYDTWSQERLAKSPTKTSIAKTIGKKMRSIGDVFANEQDLDSEFDDAYDSAIEYIRENIGDVNSDLEFNQLSAKDFSRIAKSPFVVYDFSVDVEKLSEIQDIAYTLIEENEQTAFNDLLEIISTPEFDLVTPDGLTLAELVERNDNARQLFRRYYNSIHPSNTGSVNKGVEGEIIEYEARLSTASNSLEPTLRDGKLVYPILDFRATGESSLNGQTRPEVGVKRHYLRYAQDNGSVFAMLKNKDIYVSYKENKIYGFLKTPQLMNLYKYKLVDNNLVPIASRGEDGNLIMAAITDKVKNASKDIETFAIEEIQPYKKFMNTNKSKWETVNNIFGPLLSQDNMTTKESEYFDFVFDGDYNTYRQHVIARHYALKDLFGSDYIFMKPETLMKRIKIPFTPVQTSPSLPPRKVMFFDSKNATIEYKSTRVDGDDKIKKVKLQQAIDGEMQYIGDGTTLTSGNVFTETYPEHFGTPENATRAKTVHYYKRGEDVHMAKHQEMTLFLPEGESAVLKVNNEPYAYFVREGNNVNIYDMENNPIDNLMSNDEAKVRSGELLKDGVMHEIAGESIGMVTFTDRYQKNTSIFSGQLSYYFDDPRFQELIMDKFENINQGTFSPKALEATLRAISENGERMDAIIKNFSNRYVDVIPQNVEELAELGAGKHPVNSGFFKETMKNKFLKPMVDFKMKGSHLDFRADYRGLVNQDETIIGPNNGLIKEITRIAELPSKMNTNAKIDAVNEWLSKNKFYTMIVRHPVASSVGFGLYRIKKIEPSIGDSFILHPKEVKERFEGDHDHDRGHLVWLDQEFYNQLKPHEVPTSGLGLSQFKKFDEESTLENLSGTAEMIERMTYGQTAIGEVVNITRYAGALNAMFGKDGFMQYTVNGKVIKLKPRPFNMQVMDNDIVYKDGRRWKGKVKDLLRLYLQAAVDHPKVLLLDRWNYSRDKLINYLFYDPASPNAPLNATLVEFLKKGILDILNINGQVDNHRVSGGKSVKFDELLNKSEEYNEFVNDRAEYLRNDLLRKEEAYYDNVNSNIESATRSQDMVLFGEAKFAKNSNQPMSLQEKITIKYAEMLDKIPGKRNRFFNTPRELSLPVHRTAVYNIYPELFEQITEMAGDVDALPQEGITYASNISNSLTKLYESKKNKNETGSTISFIERLTPKTWDYNKQFVEFYKFWSKKYEALSPLDRKLATIQYLFGTVGGNKRVLKQDLNTLPPIKRKGGTTLDPEIMAIYFKEYNSLLNKFEKDTSILTELRKSPKMSMAELRKDLGCGK